MRKIISLKQFMDPNAGSLHPADDDSDEDDDSDDVWLHDRVRAVWRWRRRGWAAEEAENFAEAVAAGIITPAERRSGGEIAGGWRRRRRRRRSSGGTKRCGPRWLSSPRGRRRRWRRRRGRRRRRRGRGTACTAPGSAASAAARVEPQRRRRGGGCVLEAMRWSYGSSIGAAARGRESAFKMLKGVKPYLLNLQNHIIKIYM